MPVRLTIEIPELDALKALFAQAPELVQRESHQAMAESVAYLEGEVKKLTPVVTGTLRRSVTGRATAVGPAVVGVVYSNKRYAEAVERGAKPRLIRPRRKNFLYWKGAAHPVKRVNWPGFTGRFMFRRGMSKSRPQIQRFFEAALQRVREFLDK